jgi:hypothetical protein
MPFMAEAAAPVAPDPARPWTFDRGAPGIVLAPPTERDRPVGHLLGVHLLGQLKVRLDEVAVDD